MEIHKHTDTQAHEQAHRHINSWTHRQTDICNQAHKIIIYPRTHTQCATLNEQHNSIQHNKHNPTQHDITQQDTTQHNKTPRPSSSRTTAAEQQSHNCAILSPASVKCNVTESKPFCKSPVTYSAIYSPTSKRVRCDIHVTVYQLQSASTR